MDAEERVTLFQRHVKQFRFSPPLSNFHSNKRAPPPTVDPVILMHPKHGMTTCQQTTILNVTRYSAYCLLVIKSTVPLGH